MQPAPVMATDTGAAGPLSVCHVIGKAGFRSETWVDAQILGARRYAGRLWTLRPPADP